MKDAMSQSVALIGFGEAGATFASAGNWRSRARAFDIRSDCASAMAKCGVSTSKTISEVLSNIPLVLSVVTADQALNVATDYAPAMMRNAIWCDMNSVSPETKREAARRVEASGGRYVDVAVLAPVAPARLNVPLLLAGNAAGDARDLLLGLGFTKVNIVGADVGRASAIKMIRSVVVKGIEALTDEMMQAARAANVVDEVLNSLDASEKAISWHRRSEYNLERMARHGRRRAAEMEEAAKTLSSLGVQPVMTTGTIIRQREAGEAAEETKKAIVA